MEKFEAIIAASDPAAALISHLRDTSGDLLTNTIAYMQGRLGNVRLDAQSSSLRFDIDSADTPATYEIGWPQAKVDQRFNKVLDAFPDLAVFYRSNNGLFYSLDRSLGPAPMEDWFVLAEEEWGILEEYPCPDLNLDKIIALFGNGMGSYVCVNTDEPLPDRCGILWSSKSCPKTGLDPLAVIDEWTRIGMER